MPFIKRKLSKENKNIVERKILEAQERPDDVFDLAECGMHQVPDGVYSYCRVLRKNVLRLNHNKLHDLKGGGQLSNLCDIKVLDLSHNSLHGLTKDISALANLQKLDLSFNKLKRLPDELGNCMMLRELSVAGNRLSSLISNMRNLQQLRILDISGNQELTHLPTDLCFLSKLEKLDCDLSAIRYPPSEVSVLGINEIRRWLRLVVGDEYDSVMVEVNQQQAASGNKVDESYELISDGSTVEFNRQREDLALQKHKELAERILQSEMEDKRLLETVSRERDDMSNRVQMQELHEQQELDKVYNESTKNRLADFEAWLNDEDNIASETMLLVLQMSERTRNAEAVLEELERDREHLEKLYNITQEESDRLRKQEVLDSMSFVLEECQRQNSLWESYESRKSQATQAALLACAENNIDLDRELQGKATDRSNLAASILHEEEAQKEAFLAMQFQQDAILSRIREQVELVEAELMQITKQEIDRRQQDEDEEMLRLDEMRTNTAMILSRLMEEKQQREEELNRRLGEMEAQKADDEKDYWLVQFQRLLDSKPQSLKDEEFLLDQRVVDLLLQADAINYRPLFARRRVTWSELTAACTDDGLRELGVANAEARVKIIKTMKLMQEDATTAAASGAQLHQGKPAIATDISAKQERECVICLERAPDTIMLMCGHVCTCGECCGPLTDCPICRQPIMRTCRLYNL